MQSFDGAEPRQWFLNQDMIFALGLLRDGDNWVRPIEDYVIVARLRRDREGAPIALEIRNEFLRDYLCARKHFLRVSWYRSRKVIVADPAEVGHPKEKRDTADNERFELRAYPVLEGGGIQGTYAVFHVARTDVDPDEDVPVPGPETNDNIEAKSWKGKHEGKRLFCVEAELWRDEEIAPAANSPRVRRDQVPTGISYIVDASGARMTSEELDDEDIMRWLWFKPTVVPAVMGHRGTSFEWYTNETGGVGCGPGSLTHFGLNSTGLVTVYAYDVAKLDLWQQRIWAGHNVAPEGGVSKELLSAQTRAVVADTKAPEQIFANFLRNLDPLFSAATGSPFFRAHGSAEKLVELVSWFRALEKGGLFALAKDIVRVFAERIDIVPLNKLAPPPPKEKWGSLKSLEKYLATLVPAEIAHRTMGPLFGVYELRLADAHLGKTELENALKLVGINAQEAPLQQGYQLIDGTAKAIWRLAVIVDRHLRAKSESSSGSVTEA